MGARGTFLTEARANATRAAVANQTRKFEPNYARIYGYYPSEQGSRPVQLQPVLSLRSRVGRVVTIESGASVGYGRAWTAQRRSRVALVMAGYADGRPRLLSDRSLALVRGERAPLVGRMAMDMHMMDITDIADVETDDEVTLIGEQGLESIWASELATLAGTINYEILAGVSHRVPRLLVKGGRTVAIQDLAGYRDMPAP